MPLNTEAGQKGWNLSSDRVRAFVTRTGGHVAPVTFKLGRKSVQPFSIAPWRDEKQPGIPTMLQMCRGDFFCAPFGGNAEPFRGETHPAHGESANREWTLESLERKGGRTLLHASMKTKARKGRIDKRVQLRGGESVMYFEHVLSGMSGPMPVGTHPMLKFPERPGCARISVSGFQRGYVAPVWEEPSAKGYSWLKLGASFTSLKRVPSKDGGHVDLSVYPARRGFEELVMLVGDPRQRFAWSAVAVPSEGYVFFSLKDPRVLRQTVFWFSNGGRYYAPWNGRHVNVLGVEEVTAYFHLGLPASARPNAISRAGSPTALTLNRRKPTRVAHILGLAAIPQDFDEVAKIVPTKTGIRLVARSGRTVEAPVDLGFLE